MSKGLSSAIFVSALIVSAGAVSLFAQTADKSYDDAAEAYARKLLLDGKEIFRHDTFGSEEFWGGKLKLDEAIAGEKNGGVGPGISPQKALELGLKVDVNAVPKEVAEGINSGKVDLADPASTLALLKADAVVGVKGFFSDDGKTLTSWASSAHSVTPPSMMLLRPASVIASTAGPTAISTSAPSSLRPPT